MAKGSGPHEGGALLCIVSLSLDVNKNTQILKREVLRSLRLRKANCEGNRKTQGHSKDGE